MTHVSNLLFALLVSVLIGVGIMFYIISRLDRSEQSGCFYTLNMFIIAVGLTILCQGMVEFVQF